MVNSSFEWFPGMPIHHSKDLVNWELIGYGLHRPSQLTLQEGLGDFMGIFAATLRHHNGLFYLITTCVQCEQPGNFFITAKNPAGPWSDPVWLDAPGIDPSLMWDDDGKAYYVGHGNLSGKQEWTDQEGVWLQEFDSQKGKLIGSRKQLTFGHANNAQWTEGPHLYKINGKYLLMVAEGGTGFYHSITVHHSDSVWGPYIADQVNPVLTHRHFGRNYPIHSVGHADLVQTQTGEWWSVMLGKRYVDGYTLLARETFLAEIRFEERTPVFNPGEGKVLLEQKRPALPWHPFAPKANRDDFDGENLDLRWNFLRTPREKWHHLEKGHLWLKLRPHTLNELSNPSLIAQRIRHHNFIATMSLDFSALTDNELTGMALYRRSTNHYVFSKHKDYLKITRSLGGKTTEVARVPFNKDKVILQAQANGTDLQFYYGDSINSLQPIGSTQTLSVISFEASEGFNGPFVGIYASSNGTPSNNNARINWFDY